MMMKKIMAFLFLISIFTPIEAQTYKFAFQNPALPTEARINDLVYRLTLSEKAGLMLYNSDSIPRLSIPAYNWWNECLHGIARAGKATVFPQAIGLAATFDPSLVYTVASAVSDEARAKFNAAASKHNTTQYTGLTFWTPNINIFRDPRWGRGQETYGEDPFLSGTMGSAFVKGLQGDDTEHLKAAACAKHFVVHSGPEKTRHEFNAVPNETDFRETYLPAFKMLVDAGVEAVMCAYNRTYDEPCCGSSYLLNDILRKEWRFKGHIVSDCWALDDIWARHKTVETRAEAAAMAANAGVNLNCGYIYKYLPEAVEKGLVDEATIDRDLKILLNTRFRLGLFDPPGSSKSSFAGPQIVDCIAHQGLALEAATESIILLQNKNGVLPLDEPKTKKIFVTGPNATDLNSLLGNYNGFSGNMVTLLEGITGFVNAGTIVDYSQGWMPGKDSTFHGFWEAGMADVSIMAMGINRMYEGEEGDAMLNPSGGDRTDISLPAEQIRFLKKLRTTAGPKPIIAVVFGGSAMDLREVCRLADAVLFAWYPGEQGGKALADIIFGKENPSGRLPITFYNSVNDLPPFDNYSMQGRTYKFFRGKPEFPFGYGLSYTQFTYSNLSISPVVSPGNSIAVTLNVTNTGKFAGSEVVQIYTSSDYINDETPIKSLAGFARVQLKPDETRTITIEFYTQQLARWDLELKQFVVRPCEYTILVGASSEDIRLQGKINVRK